MSTRNTNGSDGDEVRCSLPDAVVGIGGAGKKVVYRMFEEEWILREALEEREDAVPPGLRGFVIDTATEEQRNKDVPKVQRINQRVVDFAEDEFGIPEHLINETDLTYINPLDSTPMRFQSSDGLTRKNEVGMIAEEAALNAWWLEQSQYMLDETEDFSDGVDRRRGVSKALFHASQVNGGPFDEINSPQVYENITFIVGLGGGTGSGMFIDLARELDNEININLVGIIPHRKEEGKYRANAQAALSELEYLSTSEVENPFNSIVLLPFAPARELEDNKKFDEAAVQTIVGYANLDDNEQQGKIELGGERISYAPFTIAAPQTLRFDVAQARNAKETIDVWVSQRKEFLESEHELYDVLEEYIGQYFKNEPPAAAMKSALERTSIGQDDFTVPRDEAVNLRSRLDDHLDVLEMREMGRVGYTNAQEWAETIRSGIEAEEDKIPDEVDDRKRNQTVVMQASSLVYSADEDPEEKVRESDVENIDQFEEFVRSELRAIHRRATLYATSSVISDITLRTAIRDALDKDIRQVAEFGELNQDLNEITSDIDDLKNNVGCLKAALGDSHEIDLEYEEFTEEIPVPDVDEDTLEKQVESKMDDWKKASISDFEKLRELDGSVARIESLLEDLETDIKRAIERINRWDSASEYVEQPLTFDRFDELRRQCQKIGIDPPDEKEIRNPIRHAASAHEVWLSEQETQQGVFDAIKTILGFSDGGGQSNEEKYRNLRRELQDTFVEVQDFHAPFEADPDPKRHTQFSTTIQSRRDEILESLAKGFENRLQTTGSFPSGVDEAWRGDSVDIVFPGDVDGYRERFERALPEDFSDFTVDRLQQHLLGKSNVPSLSHFGVVDEAFSAALLSPVERLKSSKEEELDELYREEEQIQRIKDIVNEEGSNYAEQVDEQSNRPTIDQDQSATSDYQYFRVVPPMERRLMREDEDIVDADLWDEEARVIQQTFGSGGEFVQNSTSEPLMPVKKLRFGGDNTGYDGHRIATIFMSRAFETQLGGGGIFKKTEKAMRRGVQLPDGHNGYRAKRSGYGAPWDVTMVTFVSGVFLDNITDVIRQNGYRNTYLKQSNELMEDIRVRHTHGLDGLDEDLTPYAGEGGFAVRTELFNLDDPADVNRICDSPEETLVDEFKNRVDARRFNSTIEIERDTRPERPSKQRPETQGE